MSGVFRNIDPPPPHRPASVYPPPLVRGEYTLAWWRGGGGYSSKDDRHALYSIYVSTLWCQAFYPVVRIGSPTHSPARECCSPFGSKEGDTLTFRGRGGGEPIPTMGHTLWHSRYTLISGRPMLWNTVQYYIPPPPPRKSQLRWSFRQIIYRKKPRKITVWGCILRYQWDVCTEKTPRNVPVWQKIRQSIPLLI